MFKDIDKFFFVKPTQTEPKNRFQKSSLQCYDELGWNDGFLHFWNNITESGFAIYLSKLRSVWDQKYWV